MKSWISMIMFHGVRDNTAIAILLKSMMHP